MVSQIEPDKFIKIRKLLYINTLEVDSDDVSIHHVKDGLDLATHDLDVLGALLDSVGETT